MGNLVGKGQTVEVGDEATELIEYQVLVCIRVLSELFFSGLNDALDSTFDTFESLLEDVSITLWVKAFLDEILTAFCLLFLHCFFPFPASESILDFQLQHVVNGFLPDVHIGPDAMVREQSTQVDFSLLLLVEEDILT